MYIASVKISNFRLFEELSVQLNPGLNLLVGENDAGKTSFIDAIRLCLGTNSKERTFISESDFREGESTLTIQIKFAAVEEDAFRFVEHLSFEDCTDEHGNTVRKPVLFIQLAAKKTGTERRGYPYIQTEVRTGVHGNGLPIESEIRDFLAATYLKPLRDAQAGLSTGRASRISQILNSSKDIQQSATWILNIIARANTELLADGSALKRSADNIRDNYLHRLIFEIDKDNLGAFIDIAGVKQANIANLSEDQKRRYLRTVLEGLSLALSEDGQLHGLGYQNLLFMAAEMLLLEQESSQEFPLLLIEEPEAHLHPQLQLKLLQFIETKVSTNENSRGIQCVLSTHSPNLASKADPRAILTFGHGKAWSMREGETELDADDYVFVQKFLDVTKASLFFARGLILVEGDAENILLPTIATLLGLNLEDNGVSIIKYDNNGSWKRFARLFLRTDQDDRREHWHPTRVSVLRDLDLWPDCAEENDQYQFGFKTRKHRNRSYWRENCDDVGVRRTRIIDGLNRQNVRVFVSDDWTFEFCLAKYGLFSECFETIHGRAPTELDEAITADEKGTSILSQASKTDFAYKISALLEQQYADQQTAALEALGEDSDADARKNEFSRVEQLFAAELREKLPQYIVRAIDYAIGISDQDPQHQQADQ